MNLLDEEVALLRSSLGGLPRAVEADEILHAIWLDDVHHSTAIEGNTMTRAQVADLVERGRASAGLIENLEVKGYADAADWVYRHAPDYSHVPVGTVSEVHKRALKLAWDLEPPATRDEAGAWRKTSVAVRSVKVSVPAAIPADLGAWSASTSKLADRHPVVHAAIHHAWFERIHPFTDGNGRVGRLLLNFMLIQRGYPPAVILKSQRPRYLRALQLADDGNPNPLTEVIARAVSGTLTRFLIPSLAGAAKLIPLSALAAQGPYPVQYLRLLVFEGKLRAVRDGHLWLSSRKWLDDYIAARDPRGGKPKGTKRGRARAGEPQTRRTRRGR
ncbi:MAG TPA: Fic family protein [Methylomirabilota bacterium]|nr:Fic family protein [Methylomirabilota bacterium]